MSSTKSVVRNLFPRVADVRPLHALLLCAVEELKYRFNTKQAFLFYDLLLGTAALLTGEEANIRRKKTKHHMKQRQNIRE